MACTWWRVYPYTFVLMKSNDPRHPAFSPCVYTESNGLSQLYHTADNRIDLRPICFNFLCICTSVLYLGHYPEDNTHKLHGICDQGISFIKCCVPHQNFNLFYLMFDLGLSKTGANQNVLEMVSISASTIVQDTARSLQCSPGISYLFRRGGKGGSVPFGTLFV